MVVGGGISGLAAAHFFRKRGPARADPDARQPRRLRRPRQAQRVHASAAGLLIGYGGTQSIDSRRAVEPCARACATSSASSTDRFSTAARRRRSTRSSAWARAIFFDPARWAWIACQGRRGNQAEGPVPPDGWWRASAENAPFSERATAGLRPSARRANGLPAGQSTEQKRATLRKTSYRDFLINHAKVDPQVADYFQQRPAQRRGIGADAAPAFAAGRTWPGLQGLGLPGGSGDGDPYIFHFPDGNASIARLLVRRLVPRVSPTGTTMDDVVTARFDYGQLDAASVHRPHAPEQHGRPGAPRGRAARAL